LIAKPEKQLPAYLKREARQHLAINPYLTVDSGFDPEPDIYVKNYDFIHNLL
jgi:hypothetical protein